MSETEDRSEYRAIIDELVLECRAGQGAIAPRHIRSGGVRRYALDDEKDAHINAVLSELDSGAREAVASLMEEAFAAGVHATLVALHEHEVPPFEDGYEGTPFHDFVGRLTLDDWDWPGQPPIG